MSEKGGRQRKPALISNEPTELTMKFEPAHVGCYDKTEFFRRLLSLFGWGDERQVQYLQPISYLRLSVITEHIFPWLVPHNFVTRGKNRGVAA